MLETLHPAALVYLKYDLWPNLVWEAGRRGVPQFLLSATLGERSWRFSSGAGRAMYRTLYAALTGIFPVSEADAERYRRTHPGHRCIEVLGDTRFDGVLERRKSSDTMRLNTMQLPVFPEEAVVFAAGSTWPADEACILPVLIEALERYPALVLVLAPHEIEEKHLRALEARLGDTPPVRLTRLGPGERLESRVLLVDTVGHLAALYSRAALAYVGGGFSGNLHNVLEPAAEGIPVLFGPRHRKDPQAGALIAAGGARSIAGGEAFREALHALLDDPAHMREAGAAAAQFVESRAGAAARSCEHIQAVLA
jgi:3-deoxy-D-manno-octulosonic-acid transferase